MQRNPTYVFLYCCQLLGAFVCALPFRHKCTVPFCVCHEGDFILASVDIRPETEQNILFKMPSQLCVRFKRIFMGGIMMSFTVIFSDRERSYKKVLLLLFNKMQKSGECCSFAFESNKEVGLSPQLSTSRPLKPRKDGITSIFTCDLSKNFTAAKALGNT